MAMPIVSISLNDEILAELDMLKKTMGFSGRSEAIRAGIRNFVSEEKQKIELSGIVHAILLVVHNDEFDHIVSDIIYTVKLREKNVWNFLLLMGKPKK